MTESSPTFWDSCQHSDDANLNIATKCCPIDHTIEIINKTIKCVPNYTHGSHWESYKVNVSQKKGHIILENDNISLIIEPNGILQMVDGKKTIFYDDYCVDFDQDDIFMAVIHNKTIPSLEVPVIQPIWKCCPLDETVEQKGLVTNCIKNYRHSAQWKDLQADFSMTRGSIIMETDEIRLSVLQNGTLLVKKDNTDIIDFYNDYCVDHNQYDTYIAIVKDHAPKTIKKCCEVGKQAHRLDYTITECFTTKRHLAFWNEFDINEFKNLRKGRIIMETEDTRFNILDHGVLRITYFDKKTFKDYPVNCLDFDQDDNLIAIVKEDNQHSFYSLWPEQMLQNLTALELTGFAFIQILSFLCMIGTATVCLWLSTLIPYKHRARCLGYLGVCLCFGLVTDGFWMSSIFRNISNLCFLIAYGWMTVVWIIVCWRSQYRKEIQFRQFIVLFSGIPCLSGLFLIFAGWIPCLPFYGGHSSELLSCFGIHISVYLLIDLVLMIYTSIILRPVLKKNAREELDSDFRDFLDNYRKARIATIIVMNCWIIEFIELYYDTFKVSFGLLNVFRGFAVGIVGYLAYKRLVKVLKERRQVLNSSEEANDGDIEMLDI